MGDADNDGRELTLDGGEDAGGDREWQNGGVEARNGEDGHGSVGMAREGETSGVQPWERWDCTIETEEGGVPAREWEGTIGTERKTRGDRESGDITAVEEAGNDTGERIGDVREDGGEVEYTSGGAVDWGETETNGEGRLSGDTGEAHVVGEASNTIEDCRNELLEERRILVGSLVAQADGGVDVEGTSSINADVKASNDGLDNGFKGVLTPRGRSRSRSRDDRRLGLPLGCILRVSWSSTKQDWVEN